MLLRSQLKIATTLVTLTIFTTVAAQAQVGAVMMVASSALSVYSSLNASGAPNLDPIILDSILQLAEQNLRIARGVAELDRKVSELPVEIGRFEFERKMQEQLDLLERLHRESLNSSKLGIGLDFSRHMARLNEVHSTLTEMLGGYGSLLKNDTGDGASQISLVNALVMLFTTVAKTGEMLAFPDRYRSTLVGMGTKIEQGGPDIPRLSLLSYLTLLESIRDKIGQLSDHGTGRVYRLAMNRQVGDYFRFAADDSPKGPQLLVDADEFDEMKLSGKMLFKLQFSLKLFIVVRTWRGVFTKIVPTDTRMTVLWYSFKLNNLGDFDFSENKGGFYSREDFVENGHLTRPQVEATLKKYYPVLPSNEFWELRAARTRWAETVEPKIGDCLATLEPVCIDDISLNQGHPDFQNVEDIKLKYKNTVARIRKIGSDAIAAYNYSLQLHTLARMKTRLDGMLHTAGMKK